MRKYLCLKLMERTNEKAEELRIETQRSFERTLLGRVITRDQSMFEDAARSFGIWI
jgi:hypothetical protein